MKRTNKAVRADAALIVDADKPFIHACSDRRIEIALTDKAAQATPTLLPELVDTSLHGALADALRLNDVIECVVLASVQFYSTVCALDFEFAQLIVIDALDQTLVTLPSHEKG